MDVSERYEQLIAFLTTHLPAPIEQEEHDGIMVFTGGEPGEVVARLTNSSVIIEEYAVKWETPFKPVVHPRRVGAVRWRRLSETALMTIVGQLIRGARDVRLSRYRSCRFCAKTNPPEWQHGDDVCQACAANHLGVVH